MQCTDGARDSAGATMTQTGGGRFGPQDGAAVPRHVQTGRSWRQSAAQHPGRHRQPGGQRHRAVHGQ